MSSNEVFYNWYHLFSLVKNVTDPVEQMRLDQTNILLDLVEIETEVD